MEGFTADDLRRSFENLAIELHRDNGKIVESNTVIISNVRHIDTKMN